MHAQGIFVAPLSAAQERFLQRFHLLGGGLD